MRIRGETALGLPFGEEALNVLKYIWGFKWVIIVCNRCVEYNFFG